MIDKIDLTLGQKPTEADWESWLNRVIDFINSGIPADYLAKVGGKVQISISGDAATLNGKTADQIIAGDFPELKATLIDALTGGYGLVIKGGLCTKNGTTPTQLDITACSVIQKADGVIDRVDLSAMSKATAIANTTYFLDVVAASSDFSWGTAHPAGTYVTIATITTDLNAQIATITDTRPLTAELFKGFDCKIVVPDLQTQVDTIGEDLDAAETVIAALQQGATTTSNSLTALSETVEVHTGDNALHDKAFRIGHTYAIPGEIKVPSGDTNYVIPFFVSLVTGQTAKLAKCRYRINSGTSVTCKLQKNGADITGYTGMSVTTTTAQTDADDVTLADNDMLALIVTAVSGTPKNMTFTLFIDYEQ